MQKIVRHFLILFICLFYSFTFTFFNDHLGAENLSGEKSISDIPTRVGDPKKFTRVWVCECKTYMANQQTNMNISFQWYTYEEK